MGINPALASARLRSPLKKHFKEKWRRKESSALSSSLPSLLLQHPFHGREGASHNHFVTASTPSLGLAMHTEETQTPSVGLVDLDAVMFPATLTVATSNQLPVHQGASLPTPVMCNMVSSCYRPTLLRENRFRGCRCDTLIDTVIFKLQPCSVQIIRLSEIKF